MRFYELREEDRQFLASLLYGTGIILFWRGIWEVSYEIPLLENVYFCLFVGLFILTVTGYMYREFDPLSQKFNRISKILNHAIRQTKSGVDHMVYYHDEVAKHEHKINPKDIRKVEHDMIVFQENGHEYFVPLNRLTKIHKGDQAIWKR
ncbi:hypothetical protein J4219_08280 [Candidatus Woesearchaeota archaeon]|nr:hypothetical protein [Candidatus Woesearchaeota archaeon]